MDKRRGEKSALLGTGFREFKCPGFSDRLGLFLLMWPEFAAKEPLQFRNGLYWCEVPPFEEKKKQNNKLYIGSCAFIAVSLCIIVCCVLCESLFPTVDFLLSKVIKIEQSKVESSFCLPAFMRCLFCQV